MYGIFYVDKLNEKIECLERYATYKLARSNLHSHISTYGQSLPWAPPITIQLTSEFKYPAISADTNEHGYWVEILPDKALVYYKKFKGNWLYAPQIQQIGYFQILLLPDSSSVPSTIPTFAPTKILEKKSVAPTEIYGKLLHELKSAVDKKNWAQPKNIDQYFQNQKNNRVYITPFQQNLQHQKGNLKSPVI